MSAYLNKMLEERSATNMSTQDPSHNVWNHQPEVNPPSPPTAVSRQLPERGPQPHSCAICQRRKVKCDRSDPCANCIKHRVQCLYVAPAPPRRRKRQSPDPQLHAKVRRYEEILQQHGVKVDELNGNHDSDRSIEAPTATSPFAGAKSDSGVESSKYGPDTPESRLSVGRRKQKPPQR